MKKKVDTIGMIGTEIVDRIDRLLYLKGLKRQALTMDLNIPAQTISNWSVRGNAPPSDILYKISLFLNVSMEFLITGEDRNEISFSEKEREIINKLHDLTDNEKEAILCTINAFSKNKAIDLSTQTAG